MSERTWWHRILNWMGFYQWYWYGSRYEWPNGALRYDRFYLPGWRRPCPEGGRNVWLRVKP